MAVEFPVDIIMNDVSLDADAEIYTPEITADDYSALANKPSINGNVLIGDKSTAELGIDHVSFADNLLANSGITSSSPYLFRKSPQNVSAELHRLTGATVAWNQLFPTATFTSTLTDTRGFINLLFRLNASPWTAFLSNTFTTAGVKQYLFKATATGSAQLIHSGTQNNFILQNNIAVTNNHAYFLSANFTGVDLTTAGGVVVKSMMLIDLTQMFGSTMADAILAMETATAGSGVAFFRSLFPSAYYPYSASALQSVQTSARVARGFNQWDEEWEVGQYDLVGAKAADSTRIRSKNFIPILPNTQYRSTVGGYYYEYGADGTFLSRAEHTANTTFTTGSGSCFMTFHTYSSYGTTYKYDITIGFSVPEMLGVYVPYEAKTYPLDNIVLRGIPKLTNGVLSYDGDFYLPTGEVTRRYGIVDLGSLTWTYTSTNAYFYASMPTDAATVVDEGVNGVCNKYLCTKITSGNFYASDKVLTYCNLNMSGSKRVFVRDTAYTDAAAFKTAVTGSKLVYILATPTTETADPYAEIQSAGETEQFVSESVVPVGNEAFYPDDLTGVVQDLAPLPTTAGIYKLQVTVSGGVPSYSWVAG